MSKNVRTSQVDHLYEAILCLKDKSECYAFFGNGYDMVFKRLDEEKKDE